MSKKLNLAQENHTKNQEDGILYNHDYEDDGSRYASQLVCTR